MLSGKEQASPHWKQARNTALPPELLESSELWHIGHKVSLACTTEKMHFNDESKS